MVTTQSGKPVQKAALSILALILGIIGLLGSVFFTVTRIPAVASALGSWVPSTASNPVAYWILFGSILVLLFASATIFDYLRKRRIGIISVNKATVLMYFIGLIVVIIGVVLEFFFKL